MNYRHAFHAGNFADVFKHCVLSRMLVHLRGKAAPFRVIDTHAGAGLYDLTAPEASRTGEWRLGINRLFTASLGDDVRMLLAPYLAVVAALNPGGELTRYPGSPLLVASLMRAQDRLIACELESKTAAALRDALSRDPRAKAIAIDGWTALSAYVPPNERRGLVLVDPPFEQPDEFARLAEGLAAAHRKWPTGSYLLWYPLKQRGDADAFAERLRELAIPRILRVELAVAPLDAGRLAANGLAIVNPPWTLEAELERLLPVLVETLGQTDHAAAKAEWIVGETIART